MSFSDADLIARALAREDHHAFGELVRRYQSPVRAFLAKMTHGDFHLADDLAQETFLRAWRKLETFRNDARFGTWLFSIAYNELRMHARRKSEIAFEDLAVQPSEQEVPSPANESQLRLDLTEALKHLTNAPLFCSVAKTVYPIKRPRKRWPARWER